jgi:hypothetical protein
LRAAWGWMTIPVVSEAGSRHTACARLVGSKGVSSGPPTGQVIDLASCVAKRRRGHPGATLRRPSRRRAPGRAARRARRRGAPKVMNPEALGHPGRRRGRPEVPLAPLGGPAAARPEGHLALDDAGPAQPLGRVAVQPPTRDRGVEDLAEDLGGVADAVRAQPGGHQPGLPPGGTTPPWPRSWRMTGPPPWPASPGTASTSECATTPGAPLIPGS